MHHFDIRPMPGQDNNVIGNRSLRFKLLSVDVPASFIDWKQAKVEGQNLTYEEAEELQIKLDRIYNGPRD